MLNKLADLSIARILISHDAHVAGLRGSCLACISEALCAVPGTWYTTVNLCNGLNIHRAFAPHTTDSAGGTAHIQTTLVSPIGSDQQRSQAEAQCCRGLEWKAVKHCWLGWKR